ncbi:hypothetical protein LUZ60_012740 [Juncus effusus]|nr:hypothetical protein LUZ60_012740 [Juncus effusus]
MACKKKPAAIGIYVGAKNLCVGVWHHGRVEIIPNDYGNRRTPAFVAFTPSGRLVGDFDKRQIDINPTNTVFDLRTLIGRRFSDPHVQNGVKKWPFRVVAGPNDMPIVVVKYAGEEKKYFAEELLSMLLKKMKEVAQNYLDCIVEDAVVTVPVFFNDAQRIATKNACTLAGLNVLRLMDEPSAAVMAYGFHNKWSQLNEKNILVFHLGGCTCDVSLLQVKNGIINLKSAVGDNHLGGDDFTNRIISHFVNEFKRRYNKDITRNSKAMERLKIGCDRVKRTFSYEFSAHIEIDCLYDGIDFSAPISQARFEEINIDLFTKCIDLTEKCLSYAKVDKDSVDFIILVGGSTIISKIQKLLHGFG